MYIGPKTPLFGGAVDSNIYALESGTLQSDPTLSRPRTRDDLFSDRTRIYSDNHLPVKKQPTFPKLIWMSYNDPILFLLTVAAVISLAIGLYQSFGAAHTSDTPSMGWVEGVVIVVIVLAGSLNDWEKQRQFQKLDNKQLESDVTAVCSAVPRLIHIPEVLVGDVVHLEPGDVVPADGIKIDGYNVVCESSATGETGLIHKTGGDKVFYAMEKETGVSYYLPCIPGCHSATITVRPGVRAADDKFYSGPSFAGFDLPWHRRYP